MNFGDSDDAASMPRNGQRVARWEERTEWVMAALAVLFLAAYAWPILQPGLSGGMRRACAVANVAVWVIFAADYAVRLALARQRVDYWTRHLADFAMVVLPVLRPLRLLRLLMLLKLLNRKTAATLRGRVGVYVTAASAVLLFCASLAVLDAERGHPGATIKGFGDAVWWAFLTVSTVGYGDVVPVTASGRLVGIGLMIGGVALLGVVTATFASWLVDRVRAVSAADVAVTQADIAQLRSELTEVRQMLSDALARDRR